MKQQNLFKEPHRLFHGGELSIRKRKTLRPLDSKRALHCSLKAQRNDLRAREGWIEDQARKAARRFGVKAYGVAVNHDHIHLLLKVPGRRAWRAFIRTFSAALARAFGQGLFALIPFTRIVSWGRDFARVLAYLGQNREEASGARAYKKRQDWYERWRFSGVWTSEPAPG